MAKHEQFLTSGHTRLRMVFRIVGPLALVSGLVCIAIAFVDFFRVFGNNARPELFWMFFLGLPILFVGSVLTIAGYMGSLSRYAAREQAPVAADTFNYVAGEVSEGVQGIASSLQEGLHGSGVGCASCGEPNDAEARFCDSCGTPLDTTCPACQTANDADAKFCDSCGGSLTG
ncbi:hypothetical protein MNBD_PLANCTO03-2155 [hydrothermal vent metagenome]|uniref:DZANK-type domain-containing protein n=1 Tax=hydrothermal vent metagenome TaxID=652676 RepID=A0A3B1DEN7_9ZZZZ